MKKIKHYTESEGLKMHYVWYLEGEEVIASFLIVIVEGKLPCLCGIFVSTVHRGKGYSTMMLNDADEILMSINAHAAQLWVFKRLNGELDNFMIDKYKQHGYNILVEERSDRINLIKQMI